MVGRVPPLVASRNGRRRYQKVSLFEIRTAFDMNRSCGHRRSDRDPRVAFRPQPVAIQRADKLDQILVVDIASSDDNKLGGRKGCPKKVGCSSMVEGADRFGRAGYREADRVIGKEFALKDVA